jgi:ribosomal silencing factor RsfS
MSSISLSGLVRRGCTAKKPAGLISIPGKSNLSDVLAFVSSATPTQLRAIKIALMQRRRDVSFDVTFKSGRVEQWTVDSPEHMIQILMGERRGISHISKGKESTK